MKKKVHEKRLHAASAPWFDGTSGRIWFLFHEVWEMQIISHPYAAYYTWPNFASSLLFLFGPLWKVQWWGWRACGAPHRRILCRAQRLALAISPCPISSPLSSPLYSIFFSLFSLGPLASLLTLVLHGGIPRHKYKRARRALARDSSTFNKGGRRNCRVLSLFSLKSSTCALYINLKLIHYKEYAW